MGFSEWQMASDPNSSIYLSATNDELEQKVKYSYYVQKLGFHCNNIYVHAD